MTAEIFNIIHLILKAVHQNNSPEVQREYANIFDRFKDLSSENIDLVLNLIALFLNSSNAVIPIATKFRLVYFLKMMTDPPLITENVKISLMNQLYLLQTLLRFALYHKNKTFPSRGEGLFFSSWPLEDQGTVNIANNLIGLTLELLQYWGQDQPSNNIFGGVYDHLMHEFDYEYPNYEVYLKGKEYRTPIDWNVRNLSQPREKSTELMFSDVLSSYRSGNGSLYIFDSSNITDKSEWEKRINELIIRFSKKFADLNDYNYLFVEKVHAIPRILEDLIQMQSIITALKKFFIRFPVVEIGENLFSLSLNARRCHLQFEKMMIQIVGAAHENKLDEGTFLKLRDFQSISNIQPSSTWDQSRNCKMNSNLDPYISLREFNLSCTEKTEKPKFSTEQLAPNLFDQLKLVQSTYEEHKVPSRTVENAQEIEDDLLKRRSSIKLKKPQNLYCIQEEDILTANRFPTSLQKRYVSISKHSEKDELVVYQAQQLSKTSKEGKPVMIAVMNNTSHYGENWKRMYAELFFRKMIQNPSVKPILEYSCVLKADCIWFVEPDLPNLSNLSMMFGKGQRIQSLFTQIAGLCLDLKHKYQIIFEELTAEDITYDEDTEQFSVQNWCKVTEYKDKWQEYNLLKDLAEITFSILGLSKEPDSVQHFLSPENSGRAQSGLLAAEKPRKLKNILLECWQAQKHDLTFDVLMEKLARVSEPQILIYNDEEMYFTSNTSNGELLAQKKFEEKGTKKIFRIPGMKLFGLLCDNKKKGSFTFLNSKLEIGGLPKSDTKMINFREYTVASKVSIIGILWAKNLQIITPSTYEFHSIDKEVSSISINHDGSMIALCRKDKIELKTIWVRSQRIELKSNDHPSLISQHPEDAFLAVRWSTSSPSILAYLSRTSKNYTVTLKNIENRQSQKIYESTAIIPDFGLLKWAPPFFHYQFVAFSTTSRSIKIHEVNGNTKFVPIEYEGRIIDFSWNMATGLLGVITTSDFYLFELQPGGSMALRQDTINEIKRFLEKKKKSITNFKIELFEE